MSNRQILSLFLVGIALCTLAVSCKRKPAVASKTPDLFYKPMWSEELYGTWINPDYPEGSLMKNPKIVIHNSGYLEAFANINDTKAPESGVMIIVRKWNDSENNIWYKVFFRSNTPGDNFTLVKISNKGSVMESIFYQANISGSEENLVESNLVPSNSHYRTYLRKTP